MHRESLGDAFGTLDEELEKLEWLASQNDLALLDSAFGYNAELNCRAQNAKGVLGQIKGQVIDELTSQRTVSAESLLRRVVQFALEEAHRHKTPISLQLFAEGRVSITNAELIMAGMIPVVKASISGLRSETLEQRRKKQLFAVACLSLELKAEAGFISFRIQDDGPGFKQSKSTRAIREYISKVAGWCSFQDFPNYGGRIDFRLPLQQGRVQAVILPFGRQSLAFPKSCLRAMDARVQLRSVAQAEYGYTVTHEREQIPLYQFCEQDGFLPVTDWPSGNEGQHLCIIGVADFSIGILCSGAPKDHELRLVPGDQWLQPESWFKSFAAYRSGSDEILLPFVDGTVLMHLHKLYWGLK